MSWRDTTQEIVELGPRGTLFRVGWELRGRTGLTGFSSRLRTTSEPTAAVGPWTYRLQLEDPIVAGRFLRDRIAAQNLERLRACADAAVVGRVLCFGRWTADFGNPIDWHRSPVTGGRFESSAPSFAALADERAGDVKYCWEAARFPHAYHMARAATFFPDQAA